MNMKIILAASPLLVTILGLMYFVLLDKYIQKRQKRVMLIALVLVITVIIQDQVDCYVKFVRSLPTLRRINSAYGYMTLPVLVVLFHYFTGGKRRYLPAWCLVGINTVVYTVSLFAPIAFEILDNGVFIRGPLGFTSHIISVILLLNLSCLAFYEFGNDKKLAVVPVFCLVLLVAAMMVDVVLPDSEFNPVSFLSYAIVICCVLFYLWMHLQLVKDYEESVRIRQRTKIMVSQIQPHFLFNTIATFKALCKRNPEQAADVADKFGKYLRQNLDSISNDDLIPVKKEIEHTRLYTDIEKVRFGNICVEYDIRDTGYSVPALTIQPIVENAIRHGVRAREEGTVCVVTCMTSAGHEIIIRDNGIGFDVSETMSDDRIHIGIRNVRERIELLCGGAMTVESEKNKGTTVTIRIPREEGANDCDMCG